MSQITAKKKLFETELSENSFFEKSYLLNRLDCERDEYVSVSAELAMIA